MTDRCRGRGWFADGLARREALKVCRCAERARRERVGRPACPTIARPVSVAGCGREDGAPAVNEGGSFRGNRATWRPYKEAKDRRKAMHPCRLPVFPASAPP